MYLLLKMVVFHCHVNLPEGKDLRNPSSNFNPNQGWMLSGWRLPLRTTVGFQSFGKNVASRAASWFQTCTSWCLSHPFFQECGRQMGIISLRIGGEHEKYLWNHHLVQWIDLLVLVHPPPIPHDRFKNYVVSIAVWQFWGGNLNIFQDVFTTLLQLGVHWGEVEAPTLLRQTNVLKTIGLRQKSMHL